MNMCNINMHFQRNNAIHLIIFDESLMENKVMIRNNVTNFLLNRFIDDVMWHLWILDINEGIVINCKKPSTNRFLLFSFHLWIWITIATRCNSSSSTRSLSHWRWTFQHLITWLLSSCSTHEYSHHHQHSQKP